MERSLYKLLLKIEQKPGMYIGQAKLSLLTELIDNYQIISQKIFDSNISFFERFSQFVRNYYSKKYKIGQFPQKSWYEVIKFFSFTDEN